MKEKNKGGAPKKPKKELLVYRESINMTESEFKKINGFYEMMNIKRVKSKSRFYIDLIISTIDNEKYIIEKIENPEFIDELNRIGTNLNQITKQINKKKWIDNDLEMKTKAVLSKITDIIYDR